MMAKITTRVERITPAKAEAYLARNSKNRPLKEPVVRRLMHALRSGHWRETHQGIAFNGDGALMDGQHRLTAIARTGVAARMPVTRGLPSDAFLAIDTGATRSPADHLALAGYSQPSLLAAVLMLQWQFDHTKGDLEKRLAPEDMPDKDDLLGVCNSHPRLVEMMVSTKPNAQVVRDLATTALWVFISYRFEIKDPELAVSFMDALRTGAGLAENSVVLLTRNRCLALSADVRARKRPARSTNLEKVALIIRAWNRVRDGKEFGGGKISSRQLGTAFPAIR